MKRLVALTVAGAALTMGQAALAQEQTWLADRQYREGAGIRVGDFELHPGIGAEFGYDSNYFRRHADEDPVGSLRLRVSPHFAVSTLGPQRRGDAPPPTIGFRFEVGGTYNEFFPVSGSEAGRDQLRSQRNFGGDAKVDLDILPGRAWSGRVFGGVGRTVQPTNEGDTNTSFNRILPTAGAELAWTPDTGMFDWRVGYQFSGTFFESAAFSGLNNYRNDITTRGRWRFFPRTAIMYDATFGFVHYADPGASAAAKTDSHPMRARVGLNGLVTPSFALLGLIGWGASFYSGNDQDFDSLLAQAEAKWYLSPSGEENPMTGGGILSTVALGFVRDFEDSFIGTYLERNQGYVRFNHLFSGVFLFVAEARAGAVVFPAQTRVAGGFGQPGGWNDLRVDGSLFGEWRAKDWLGINTELNYTGYFSDTALTFGAAGESDKLGYQNFRAFVGARVFL